MTDTSPVVAYFGPDATNTHVAAIAMFGEAASYLPRVTIADVFDAVTSGQAAHGVVPIENSIEGVVRETVDCLMAKAPLIEREFELVIAHCLMGPEELRPDNASRIVSHPQALAQCRQWLDANYPGVERISAASTSTAAREAHARRDTLAIASALAAERNGLRIVARDIADHRWNATRFICVAGDDAAPSGADRTSLVFTTAHEKGALRRVLAIFDEADVNMTRIESRPLPDRLWEYAFVVDVTGHRRQQPVQGALERLRQAGHLEKVLGSYPKAPSALAKASNQVDVGVESEAEASE